MKNKIHYEISKIISDNDSGGSCPDWAKNPIGTARNQLRAKNGANKKVETKLTKQQETAIIKAFANENNLWIQELDEEKYLDEGAEQKVYDNGKTVLKVNDSVFYETWDDYFKALLLHNLLFPYSKYTLKGFQFKNETLYSIVEQPYVWATAPYNFDELKSFMLFNGFVHKKNQDFYHPTIGIIIEDLHDENVLVSNGIHLVIDSAMYFSV